jgi:SAM-dependent methyltransferase
MAGFLDRFRNRNLKNRIKNPFDEIWDRRLGVHTFGAYPGSGSFEDGTANLPFVPSAYADAFDYLEAVNAGPDDVFVDLGAGYGRTVFAASHMGVRRAIGVDLVPLLVDGAEANRKRCKLQGRKIEFICANALDYVEPDMTILYMFHPFGEAILEQVLKNIQADRATRPDAPKLKIIYANPVYDAALERSGWLRKVKHIPGKQRMFSNSGVFDAAIWESV